MRRVRTCIILKSQTFSVFSYNRKKIRAQPIAQVLAIVLILLKFKYSNTNDILKPTGLPNKNPPFHMRSGVLVFSPYQPRLRLLGCESLGYLLGTESCFGNEIAIFCVLSRR